MGFMHEETTHVSIVQRVWAATVASDAVDFDDPIDIVIPNVDTSTRWEQCLWQPRDNYALPRRGDECVVVMDNDMKVSVVAWWPPVRSPKITVGPVSDGPLAGQ